MWFKLASALFVNIKYLFYLGILDLNDGKDTAFLPKASGGLLESKHCAVKDLKAEDISKSEGDSFMPTEGWSVECGMTDSHERLEERARSLQVEAAASVIVMSVDKGSGDTREGWADDKTHEELGNTREENTEETNTKQVK